MQAATYIWAKIIGLLEEEFGVSSVSAWFDDAELVTLNEQNLILHTPSNTRQIGILNNFKAHIDEILHKQFGLAATLLVRAAPSGTRAANPRFTFENFVEGPQNTMSLKAAAQVSEKPGNPVYNPLYIYGPPGVGKTHLLHAIANKASQLRPNTKIVCTNSEEFTSELIQALRYSEQPDFRGKYQETEILLMDDIQFLAGKEATQTELFYILNTLTEMGKQIVLTSDRSPAEMPTLTEQLRDRFGCGIMLQISPPDLPTRKQIIRVKAAQMQLDLDEETVNYLAEALRSNVHQIEGGLHKIQAFHDLMDMPLTLTAVTRVIDGLKTD